MNDQEVAEHLARTAFLETSGDEERLVEAIVTLLTQARAAERKRIKAAVDQISTKNLRGDPRMAAAFRDDVLAAIRANEGEGNHGTSR